MHNLRNLYAVSLEGAPRAVGSLEPCKWVYVGGVVEEEAESNQTASHALHSCPYLQQPDCITSYGCNLMSLGEDSL